MNVIGHILSLAAALFGFIYSAEKANVSRNWPTALMWAVLAIFMLACSAVAFGRVF